MVNISYTQSSNLDNLLKKIEIFRREILLRVISPEDELRYRWDSTVERVFWSIALSDTPLMRNEISKIIKEAQPNPLSPTQRVALSYKRALDHIYHDWLSTKKQVNLKNVVSLNQMVSGEKLNIKAEDLRNSLAYFQTSNEHPVIQAGLIHYQIFALSPSVNRNTRFSSLLSYLFLYKEGYDFRGLLVIDEYFRRNFTDYQLILGEAVSRGAQTIWLEFFAKAIHNNLEKALENIRTDHTRLAIPSSIVGLNQRQKEILTHLEIPSTTITNRAVQKMFGISQITASRDLAKLATLLLIFAHGKGRSVYYTRV